MTSELLWVLLSSSFMYALIVDDCMTIRCTVRDPDIGCTNSMDEIVGSKLDCDVAAHLGQLDTQVTVTAKLRLNLMVYEAVLYRASPYILVLLEATRAIQFTSV